jgi:hypothetical protein
VDLDRPGLDADADVTLYGDSGTVTLGVADGATVAVGESAAAGPAGCVAALRRGPVERATQVPLRESQLFCVLAGTRLAAVTITGLSDDQTVALEVTAYQLPS